MTKALVKSHVTTPAGRHARRDTVPPAPKVGAAPRRVRKAEGTAKM